MASETYKVWVDGQAIDEVTHLEYRHAVFVAKAISEAFPEKRVNIMGSKGHWYTVSWGEGTPPNPGPLTGGGGSPSPT